MRHAPEPLPEDVVRLIVEHIDSVPHLEALQLLWDGRERAWTAAEVAVRLYVQVDATRAILEELRRHGLVDEAGAAYRPAAEPATQAVVERIVAAYRSHLAQVAGILHAKASKPVREFARAFRIKRED